MSWIALREDIRVMGPQPLVKQVSKHTVERRGGGAPMLRVDDDAGCLADSIGQPGLRARFCAGVGVDAAPAASTVSPVSQGPAALFPARPSARQAAGGIGQAKLHSRLAALATDADQCVVEPRWPWMPPWVWPGCIDWRPLSVPP